MRSTDLFWLILLVLGILAGLLVVVDVSTIIGKAIYRRVTGERELRPVGEHRKGRHRR